MQFPYDMSAYSEVFASVNILFHSIRASYGLEMEDLSIFCHIFMALPGVKLQTIVDGVHTPNLLTNRLDWNQIC